MKTIECYKTSDGKVFEDEEKAQAHEDDMIGEELESLLMHVMGLNTGRSEVYKGTIKAINNKKALKEACKIILDVLQYTE